MRHDAARFGVQGALTALRVERLTSADRGPRGWRAIMAAALAGIVGLSLGLMGWSVQAIVVIVVVSVAVAWLVGSLSRAVIVISAAGGCATAVAFVGSELATLSGSTTALTWGVVVWTWVGVALVVAAGWWWRGADEEVTLVEVIAAICALLIAGALRHHLDFTASLYGVLVGHEDNAAWVLLNRTVELSGTRVAGVDTPLGPAIGTLLGVLQSTRAAGVPAVNAVVAAYGSALLLTPVITATFFRHRLARRRVATLAFFGVAFMWAFYVPSRLTIDFGHLATIYVFLALLLLLALIVAEPPSIFALVSAAGLSYSVGAFWFPLTAVAIACLVLAAIRCSRGGTRALRVSAVLMVGLVTSLLLWRLGIALQVGEAGQPGVRGITDQLLVANGVTAAADAVLTLGVLAGLVALALLFDRLDDAARRMVLLAGMVTTFVVLLLAGVSLEKAEVTSYAVTKYVFVSVMVLTVLLIAAASRYRMPPVPTVVVLVVLAFYGLTLGGGAALLSRHGVGGGPEPAWTRALKTAVATQDAKGDRRPIVCVSADPTEAYTCTRWAEALSAQYVDLGYRLGVINGTPTEEALRQLKASGGLSGTDIVVLSAPAGDQSALANLYRDAHAILGPDGTDVGHVAGS